MHTDDGHAHGCLALGPITLIDRLDSRIGFPCYSLCLILKCRKWLPVLVFNFLIRCSRDKQRLEKQNKMQRISASLLPIYMICEFVLQQSKMDPVCVIAPWSWFIMHVEVCMTWFICIVCSSWKYKLFGSMQSSVLAAFQLKHVVYMYIVYEDMCTPTGFVVVNSIFNLLINSDVFYCLHDFPYF